eukprot:jgi/Mesen1/9129/ME000058S08621
MHADQALQGHPDPRAHATPTPPHVSSAGEPLLPQERAPGGPVSWASGIGLILGTAVGPGILGLPAVTLAAGLLPSSLTIIASWTYVIASILLVAELSCALMAEQGGAEVSFTGVAARALGPAWTKAAAWTYAALNYALLAACIAGLGDVLAAVTRGALPPPAAGALCTAAVAAALVGGQADTLDDANKLLCALMVGSCGVLMALGLPHMRLQVALQRASWRPAVLLPAVPLTVLTLGFHVVTPLVCAVLRGNARDARRAILTGGAIPLAMVLAWNAVILGLASPAAAIASSPRLNPMALLLSLGTSAAPCVQAFALCALGTTLIGYSLSFPKQLADSLDMLAPHKRPAHPPQQPHPAGGPHVPGVLISESHFRDGEEGGSRGGGGLQMGSRKRVLALALAPPLLLAMLSPATFAAALDFAGVYANCFLFGILPPAMAWSLRYGRPFSHEPHDRPQHTLLVPGGKPVLVLLLLVALLLGLWRPPPPV